MTDKIAEICARHEAGARGMLPLPALAEALDDRAALLAEVERLRKVVLHISRYETVGPAGFEWDIVVEELVAIARAALEAKP